MSALPVFLTERQDGLAVHRQQGAQVHHLGGDALRGGLLGGLQGVVVHHPVGKDAQIAALAADARRADGHAVIPSGTSPRIRR